MAAEQPSNTYTCERCHQEFEYGWTEEEATAEADALFGPLDPDDIAIVCDDCYQAMAQEFGWDID